MKRLRLISIIATLAVMVVAAHLQAGEKTPVCVRFILKESAYRAQFASASETTSELLEELQARAAASISDHLTGNAGFLNFTTEDSADYTLTFTLDCADPLATGMLKEVGIYVELTKPKIKTKISSI